MNPNKKILLKYLMSGAIGFAVVNNNVLIALAEEVESNPEIIEEIAQEEIIETDIPLEETESVEQENELVEI